VPRHRQRSASGAQLELPFDRPLEAPPARRRSKLPSRRPPEALARLARMLLRRLGLRRRAEGVRVVFNPRLRTVLGRAYGRDRAVELNPRLLDRHPDELLPTLVHELCHLAAGIRDGHGDRWREAMQRLGQPPTACHALDVSDLATRRRRRWLWSCRGCGRTYVRSHRGARRFRCGSCSGRLHLAHELPPRSGGGDPSFEEKEGSV
jgi:predicted SprT family Zn-dependent metalloprotease